VHAWLAEAGLPEGSYRYDNGSGLYDSNRFTPRQLTTILRRAYRDFRTSSDFVAALAVSGADGTLEKRGARGVSPREPDRFGGPGPAERYVRAKTGSLDDVSALAGYAGAVGRAPLAFAVVVNGMPKSAARAARALADEIAAILVLHLEAGAQ
jgi:D-alanyl-D-alanine carboxypeptidase/D-alanyl-D-alanine-endopeptidase (penicillin-binding protein 4)